MSAGVCPTEHNHTTDAPHKPSCKGCLAAHAVLLKAIERLEHGTPSCSHAGDTRKALIVSLEVLHVAVHVHFKTLEATRKVCDARRNN